MARRTPKKTPVWPVLAAAVAGGWGARWSDNPAVRWLENQPANAPLVVAFSGGADSLAVLLTAWAIWPERRGRLRAVHFNHRLRGAAAERDEAFCRAVCRALRVPLRVGRATWRRSGGTVSETEARAARWKFFDRVVRTHRATAIVLGHQRDDVVETVLMRLARGSGSRGLAAPRPVQTHADGCARVRPLLAVTHAEIVEALRAAGAPWCEDATNRGGAFLRNRLRRDVVPAWAAAVAPLELGAGVARARALLEEEDAALEAWVDSVVPRGAARAWSVAGWAELPAAVVRRALHRWLWARGLGDAISPGTVDALVAAVRAGRDFRASAGRGAFVELTAGELARTMRGAAIGPRARTDTVASGVLPIPGEWCGTSGDRLVAERLVAAATDALVADARRAGHARGVLLGFDAEPGDGLRVRTWRAGDRYVPFGAKRAVKLQDQFVNRRIPRALRGVLPVITDGADRILWVPGLPPAEATRVTPGRRVLVQLTYHTAHPRSPSHDVR